MCLWWSTDLAPFLPQRAQEQRVPSSYYTSHNHKSLECGQQDQAQWRGHQAYNSSCGRHSDWGAPGPYTVYTLLQSEREVPIEWPVSSLPGTRIPAHSSGKAGEVQLP